MAELVNHVSPHADSDSEESHPTSQRSRVAIPHVTNLRAGFPMQNYGQVVEAKLSCQGWREGYKRRHHLRCTRLVAIVAELPTARDDRPVCAHRCLSLGLGTMLDGARNLVRPGRGCKGAANGTNLEHSSSLPKHHVDSWSMAMVR